jgi:hypothetical protein
VNELRPSVTEYPLGSTGNIEPSVVIAGDLTGIEQPTSIAVDRDGNIYVLTLDSVLRFAPGASGNVAPAAIIHGPATELGSARHIGVDEHGNIYVLLGFTTQIIEFAHGSAGDVPPIGQVATSVLGSLIPITHYCQLAAIGFDRAENLYARCTEAVGRVTSEGEATRIIRGKLTGLDGFGGIAFDSNGNLWAANTSGLMRYRPGATGNVRPDALIFGPATHYSIGPIAIDRHGDVFVAVSYPSARVLEFRGSSNGNAAPLAEIAGSDTHLESPNGIAIGP